MSEQATESDQLKAVRVLKPLYRDRIERLRSELNALTIAYRVLEAEEARLRGSAGPPLSKDTDHDFGFGFAHEHMNRELEPDTLPRGELKRMVHQIMETAEQPLRIKEVEKIIHRTHPNVPYYSVRTVLQRGTDLRIYVRDGDGYSLNRDHPRLRLSENDSEDGS